MDLLEHASGVSLSFATSHRFQKSLKNGDMPPALLIAETWFYTKIGKVFLFPALTKLMTPYLMSVYEIIMIHVVLWVVALFTIKKA